MQGQETLIEGNGGRVIVMDDKLRQYEEEQLQCIEERLEQEKYEEEYTISKQNLEEKLDKALRKAETNVRRNRFRIAGKAVAACVAAALVLTVSVPGMRAAATDFFHSTLGLTIFGADSDKKTDASQKDSKFSFEWIMKMTEKEYWEWLKEHALTGKEVPAYVPDGYEEHKEEMFPYTYHFVAVAEDEIAWSEKAIDPWDTDTYGHLGVTDMDSLLSEAEKKKEDLEDSVLSGIACKWKNGEKELYYSKEVYDFFELRGHIQEKGKAEETLTVNGDEAYLVSEPDGLWLYVFGDDTITMLFANKAVSQTEAKEILVKMAESI